MANRELEARLKISAIDRTSGVLNRISQRLGMVGDRVSMVNKQYGRVAATASSTAAIVGRIAIPALAAMGGVKIIKDAAELERQMNRIGDTADATVEQTKAATGAIREMTNAVALPFQDGVEAIDTLVASGMNLEEAMAFLPTVLATAQATGAATTDIANTAMKSSSALKISADEMQRAMDILVTQGKLGQFEAKDMAQYLPNVLNLWASVGYTGTDGLNMLAASLQTLREDSADASTAANQLQNILMKMGSSDMIAKFKNFKIDLPTEMAKAEAAGIDKLRAFIGLSEKAVDGNLELLPQLFTDSQVYQGMLSLITSQDRLAHFTKGGQDADGAVDRSLQRILDDNQASIDRMANSWDEFLNNVGSALTDPVAEKIDAANDQMNFRKAQIKALEAQGLSDEELKRAKETSKVPLLDGFLGFEFPREAAVLAMQGGYSGQYRGHEVSDWAIMPPDSELNTSELNDLPPDLREEWRPFGYVPPDFTGLGFGSDGAKRLPDSYVNMPELNAPMAEQSLIDRILELFMPDEATTATRDKRGRVKLRDSGINQSDESPSPAKTSGVNEGAEKIGQAVSAGADDVRKDLQAGSQTIGRAFADGAEEVRRAGNEGGAKVRSGADDVARALSDAASTIDAATKQLSGAALRRENRARRKANFNPGQSMKPEDNAPPGLIEIMRNWKNTLFPASYRGVPFWVEYDSASGGKRLAVHEHAGGYQSGIEELGRTTESFDVSAYVVGDYSDAQALALKSVLNAPGSGFLTLPIDGGMIATAERYWRSRSLHELGLVGFSITFVRHPSAAGSALTLGNVNAVVATGIGLAAAGLSSLF